MVRRVAPALMFLGLFAASAASADDPAPWDPVPSGGDDGSSATPAPAPGAPATTPAPAPASPAAPISRSNLFEDPEEYVRESQWQRELLTMEQQTNDHKSRATNAKLTLQMLRALSVEGAALGSRVRLWHVNRLGTSFDVRDVEYTVDGVKVDVNSQLVAHPDTDHELQVFEQTMPPGDHVLEVEMTLQGKNKLFSYVNAYTFKVQSSYDFTVENGRLTTVRVITHERGPLVKWEKRPQVRYDERIEELRGR